MLSHEAFFADVRAVIFDMDGTLADTEPLHCAAWQQVARQYGWTLSATAYARTVAGRAASVVLREQLGLTGAAAQTAYDAVQAQFWHLAGAGLAPLPGLLALLDRLPPVPVAVATGERRASALRRLALIGVHDRFPVVVTADDVQRPKPDPEVFLTAAARLGTPPAACLVFEDSLSGVAAARAAGMACIGVATTHTPAALVGAQLVISDYTDPRLALLGSKPPAGVADGVGGAHQ